MNYKALILDRDGVINIDRPDCVRDRREFFLIPGAIAAIAALSRAGFPVLVATNQSCIGRGWTSREAVDDLHELLRREVLAAGGCLGPIFLCPHHPDFRCDCRKPLPGLYRQALESLSRPASEVLSVGDAPRDYEASRAAGLDFALLLSGKGRKSEESLRGAPGLVGIFEDLRVLAQRFLGSDHC